MRITELIHQPEGRRVEFKESLPRVSDLAKAIVAFANDAGYQKKLQGGGSLRIHGKVW